MTKKKNHKKKPYNPVQRRQEIAFDEIILTANERMFESYVRGFSHAMIMALWSLHTTEHLGKMRLQRTFKKMQKYLEEYKVGLNYEFEGDDEKYKGVTLEDIAGILDEEFGIKIDPKTGRYEVED